VALHKQNDNEPERALSPRIAKMETQRAERQRRGG
jgi:hypothetical protein